MASSVVMATGDERYRVTLAIGSILAALGALGYVSVIIFGSELSSRESFEAPVNRVGCIVATVGLLLIALSLAQGKVLGTGWPITVSVLAFFFTAANAWFFGTGVIAVTSVVTDQQFDRMVETNGFLVMVVPKMVLGLAGLVALGVKGWRAGSLSRPAAVFLVLGGIASAIPPFPPGAILASIGLFIASRERQR
jgi:hypothetical protein